MILSDSHIMSDLKELWTFKSFRARIFLAMLPTFIAIMFAHYAADRQHPYDFFVEGSYIEPPSGKAGDHITVYWKVTRHRACDGIIERRLVDPVTNVIIASYDPDSSTGGVGEEINPRLLRKTILLPRNIQSGYIGYQARMTYACNWLQKALPRTFGIQYTTPQLLFLVEE